MSEQQGKAWDQAKFENKLACWMAACDQLFTAVTDPEFQELLQYVHQPGKENDDKAIRRRIMKMGDNMIDKLKELFATTKANSFGMPWKKFGLKGRITAFVMDNASNNDTLVEAIEYFCYNEGIPGFMMKDARMRMHATHSASCSPEAPWRLLESLTTSEAKKAAENISDGTYQESATMPMDSETLGDYSEEHSDPIDTDLDSMAIKSSICNIF
ncbi:hypothetical protein BT96DRAFT_934154 [Gymnopus androsaceus JB14]|uniref:Uncharacterized protein n=1 Tax=Gymnopus androsaceus JB14 TaxID=1447944 RepID=A0A6A4I8U8_9AGAR|nr:hypothetical protein BT96DRAFT_934154 [Gymnopus androsaceus JB14]